MAQSSPTSEWLREQVALAVMGSRISEFRTMPLDVQRHWKGNPYWQQPAAWRGSIQARAFVRRVELLDANDKDVALLLAEFGGCDDYDAFWINGVLSDLQLSAKIQQRPPLEAVIETRARACDTLLALMTTDLDGYVSLFQGMARLIAITRPWKSSGMTMELLSRTAKILVTRGETVAKDASEWATSARGWTEQSPTVAVTLPKQWDRMFRPLPPSPSPSAGQNLSAITADLQKAQVAAASAQAAAAAATAALRSEEAKTIDLQGRLVKLREEAENESKRASQAEEQLRASSKAIASGFSAATAAAASILSNVQASSTTTTTASADVKTPPSSASPTPPPSSSSPTIPQQTLVKVSSADKQTLETLRIKEAKQFDSLFPSTLSETTYTQRVSARISILRIQQWTDALPDGELARALKAPDIAANVLALIRFELAIQEKKVGGGAYAGNATTKRLRYAVATEFRILVDEIEKTKDGNSVSIQAVRDALAKYAAHSPSDTPKKPDVPKKKK